MIVATFSVRPTDGNGGCFFAVDAFSSKQLEIFPLPLAASRCTREVYCRLNSYDSVELEEIAPTSEKCRKSAATGQNFRRVISKALTGENAGSPGGTRTPDKAVNSRLLYQLSYRGVGRGGILKFFEVRVKVGGDPNMQSF